MVESRSLAVVHLPARGRAADEVEHLEWLDERETVALAPRGKLEIS